MLKVKTYLDRSGLHGIGLFASEEIKEGEIVWQLNRMVDICFTPEQWKAMHAECSPESLAEIQKYSYKEGGNYYLCADNAQFMNHSEHNPNVHNMPGGQSMVAMRNISKGEELTCNYFQYCDPDDYNLAMIAGHRPTDA